MMPTEPEAAVHADLSPSDLERLRSGLLIMATRALGDPVAAEEVAQETLVRLLTALAEGRSPDGPGGLGAYAHGIAKHVIADRHRRHERHPTQPMPSENGPAAVRDGTADPLTRLISAEERDRVRRALRRLSAEDREVLRLSFFEGLRPAEIASARGEPPPRVRKRKERALERLRRAFFGPASCHEEDRSATPGGDGTSGMAGANGSARH